MEPSNRITEYFEACSSGTAQDIAAHFTADAVIFDTNVRPIVTADVIGKMWVKVRERWLGARWTVDSIITEGSTAAIEWSMTGTNPNDQQPFTFRGSEHYRFEDSLIAEIRQYWTFDDARGDTGLVDYPYPEQS